MSESFETFTNHEGIRITKRSREVILRWQTIRQFVAQRGPTYPRHRLVQINDEVVALLFENGVAIKFLGVPKRIYFPYSLLHQLQTEYAVQSRALLNSDS